MNPRRSNPKAESVNRDVKCPNCLHWIHLPQDTFDKEQSCRCMTCFHEYRVIYDAEYKDGEWRDRTTLEPLQELDPVE